MKLFHENISTSEILALKSFLGENLLILIPRDICGKPRVHLTEVREVGTLGKVEVFATAFLPVFCITEFMDMDVYVRTYLHTVVFLYTG